MARMTVTIRRFVANMMTQWTQLTSAQAQLLVQVEEFLRPPAVLTAIPQTATLVVFAGSIRAPQTAPVRCRCRNRAFDATRIGAFQGI